MFKSTKDLDNATYMVLKKFLEIEHFEDKPSDISDEDFNTVLENIINNGFLTGIKNTQKSITGKIFIIGDPQISREGLLFIENFKI